MGSGLTTVSTERKYTLVAEPSTQNRGGLQKKWRTPYLSSGPLNFEYSARQKCILSFWGDCSRRDLSMALLWLLENFTSFVSCRLATLNCSRPLFLVSCKTGKVEGSSWWLRFCTNLFALGSWNIFHCKQYTAKDLKGSYWLRMLTVLSAHID